MEKGRIRETGSPHGLLCDNKSYFHQVALDAGLFYKDDREKNMWTLWDLLYVCFNSQIVLIIWKPVIIVFIIYKMNGYALSLANMCLRRSLAEDCTNSPA